MKTKRLIWLAAAAVLHACCGGDDEGGSEPAAKYITVKADIGYMTRVVSDGISSRFEDGDRLSLYVWTGLGIYRQDSMIVDGVVNTLAADGQWTPEVPMLWLDEWSPHYFLGISPARHVDSLHADAYRSLPTEDLLVARNMIGLQSYWGVVPLTFEHMLTRLDVNLRFRDEWDEVPTATQVTVRASDRCTVDYLTGQCSDLGDTATIVLPAVAAAVGHAQSFSGIIIPQDGVRTITVTVAGQEYTFTHFTDIRLQRGRYTTVNLTVGRSRITLDGVTINDWRSGQSLDDVYAERVN